MCTMYAYKCNYLGQLVRFGVTMCIHLDNWRGVEGGFKEIRRDELVGVGTIEYVKMGVLDNR